MKQRRLQILTASTHRGTKSASARRTEPGATRQAMASISRQARLIFVGASLLLALGMGMRQSFGLFLAPVTRDLGVTAADFTLALAVQNIVWGFSQALV